MIIGDGDIASALPDRADRTFFASGVSNSREAREYQYQMEIDLLMSQNKDRQLIYFSTLSIFYTDTRYAKHKRFMERLIKKHFPHYCILRLGNITWGKNPNTLINAMFLKHVKGKPLEIRDEYRYIVNKDDFLYWINLIPDWNCEMNIPGKRMKVKEVVEKYVLLSPSVSTNLSTSKRK